MEDNVKKSLISPVTSLLVSLSLALGILVCNISDYGFLTTAHACGGGGSNSTVVGDTLAINNALAPDGVAFRNILVNGQFVEAGVIAGPVQLVSGSVVNANGVIVSNGDGGTESDGVVVGNGGPCVEGVIVSNGGDPAPNPAPNGVIVSNGGDPAPNPAPNGVIVSNGDDDPATNGGAGVGNQIGASGYIVGVSGTANGGTLTGDNITVTDGIVTGQNLLLSGSTIDGGFITVSGAITSVNSAPAN
jgi:hypothetical protein